MQVKVDYGIYPRSIEGPLLMSDEPIHPGDGIATVPRAVARVIDHRCEHAGCTKWGGFGFGKPKQESHWFCYGHRAEGERFL